MDGKRLTYQALIHSPVMLNNESHRPPPRHIWRRQRDMRTPQDRLTPKEVLVIKEMRRTRDSSYKAIALRFKVAPSLIEMVVNGKYKHDAKPGRKRKK